MIYVFLAEGFEEVEALTPVDVLRRAKQTVQTVGVGGRVITGAHGISVTADITADELRLDGALQLIVLPGGMPGTLNLEASDAGAEIPDAPAVRDGNFITGRGPGAAMDFALLLAEALCGAECAAQLAAGMVYTK